MLMEIEHMVLVAHLYLNHLITSVQQGVTYMRTYMKSFLSQNKLSSCFIYKAPTVVNDRSIRISDEDLMHIKTKDKWTI